MGSIFGCVHERMKSRIASRRCQLQPIGETEIPQRIRLEAKNREFQAISICMYVCMHTYSIAYDIYFKRLAICIQI